LVVQLVPQGLLFAADRNITSETTLGDQTVMVTVSGQSQRPKVLKWPNAEVIVGYVGEGRIEGKPTDQWLYDFIGRNLAFDGLTSLAEALRADLDRLYQRKEFQQALILHLGGFELVAGEWTPRIYFVHNTAGLRANGTYYRDSRFGCTEELGKEGGYFEGQSGTDITRYLQTHYFSFRQGADLAAFNTLDEKQREAMQTLIQQHPARRHLPPTTLDDWSQHLAFAVHGYGAYFASFYPPFDQRVGGGADVVWAEWPSTLEAAGQDD
jgi:hypothetical protein